MCTYIVTLPIQTDGTELFYVYLFDKYILPELLDVLDDSEIEFEHMIKRDFSKRKLKSIAYRVARQSANKVYSFLFNFIHDLQFRREVLKQMLQLYVETLLIKDESFSLKTILNSKPKKRRPVKCTQDTSSVLYVTDLTKGSLSVHFTDLDNQIVTYKDKRYTVTLKTKSSNPELTIPTNFEQVIRLADLLFERGMDTLGIIFSLSVDFLLYKTGINTNTTYGIQYVLKQSIRLKELLNGHKAFTESDKRQEDLVQYITDTIYKSIVSGFVNGLGKTLVDEILDMTKILDADSEGLTPKLVSQTIQYLTYSVLLAYSSIILGLYPETSDASDWLFAVSKLERLLGLLKDVYAEASDTVQILVSTILPFDLHTVIGLHARSIPEISIYTETLKSISQKSKIADLEQHIREAYRRQKEKPLHPIIVDLREFDRTEKQISTNMYFAKAKVPVTITKQELFDEAEHTEYIEAHRYRRIVDRTDDKFVIATEERLYKAYIPESMSMEKASSITLNKPIVAFGFHHGQNSFVVKDQNTSTILTNVHDSEFLIRLAISSYDKKRNNGSTDTTIEGSIEVDGLFALTVVHRFTNAYSDFILRLSPARVSSNGLPLYGLHVNPFMPMRFRDLVDRDKKARLALFRAPILSALTKPDIIASTNDKVLHNRTNSLSTIVDEKVFGDDDRPITIVALWSGGLDSTMNLVQYVLALMLDPHMHVPLFTESKTKDVIIIPVYVDYGQKTKEAEYKVLTNILIPKTQKLFDTLAKLVTKNDVPMFRIKIQKPVTLSVSQLFAGISSILITGQRANTVSDAAGTIAYVPNRNAVLLSLAGSVAEQHEADVIILGANLTDGLTYKDNSPLFIDSMTRLLMSSLQKPVYIEAPLQDKTKNQFIESIISFARYKLRFATHIKTNNEVLAQLSKQLVDLARHTISCRYAYIDKNGSVHTCISRLNKEKTKEAFEQMCGPCMNKYIALTLSKVPSIPY